jgi:hypothetical protein
MRCPQRQWRSRLSPTVVRVRTRRLRHRSMPPARKLSPPPLIRATLAMLQALHVRWNWARSMAVRVDVAVRHSEPYRRFGSERGVMLAYGSTKRGTGARRIDGSHRQYVLNTALGSSVRPAIVTGETGSSEGGTSIEGTLNSGTSEKRDSDTRSVIQSPPSNLGQVRRGLGTHHPGRLARERPSTNLSLASTTGAALARSPICRRTRHRRYLRVVEQLGRGAAVGVRSRSR